MAFEYNLNPDYYPASDSGTTGGGGGRLADPDARMGEPVIVGSPEWWLERLLGRLRAQSRYCKAHWDFYDGDQPLAFAGETFEAAYGKRYRRLPSNFMPLVVDAEAERLVVQGFRFGGSTQTDPAAWRIWQANNLDGESQIAHEVALAKGVAYTLITPGSTPLITVEDPEQVVVETLPGNRRIRLAALKAWKGEDGFLRAYLYLPTEVYKFISRNRATSPWGDDKVGNSLGSDGAGQVTTKAVSWQPERPRDEDFPITNPLGVVPVVPLLNRPTLEGEGRSEIVPVIGNQNAINFLRFAALIGSDHAALPQRWARNLDLEVDPDTGAVKAPFKPGIQYLWATRRPTEEETAGYGDRYPQTEFGQFPQADFKPFTDLIDQEISQMASISRTPYHYLLGQPSSVPPTGESIKSSEAPLVKKVKRAAVHFGEGWEETLRVALIAAGQRGKARADGETVWADPETRNEAARTDSIIKQYEAGLLTQEVALTELGYSPQVVQRIISVQATTPEPPEPEEEVAGEG